MVPFDAVCCNNFAGREYNQRFRNISVTIPNEVCGRQLIYLSLNVTKPGKHPKAKWKKRKTSPIYLEVMF